MTERHAFKEWAVICRALAEGRQSLILRKGGVAEAGGEFVVDHLRFWLYPTYVHEKAADLRPDAAELLTQVEAERPAAGVVRLSHFAEVDGAYHLHDLVTALKLQPFHLWSHETVQARFVYRRPGLYALPVRVYRAAEVLELPETPAYVGCKTWVDLGRELSIDGAVPVLGEAAFAAFRRELEVVLEPTALA
jgi:hypothetical protein